MDSSIGTILVDPCPQHNHSAAYAASGGIISCSEPSLLYAVLPYVQSRSHTSLARDLAEAVGSSLVFTRRSCGCSIGVGLSSRGSDSLARFRWCLCLPTQVEVAVDRVLENPPRLSHWELAACMEGCPGRVDAG
jgi:hypothetical protein